MPRITPRRLAGLSLVFNLPFVLLRAANLVRRLPAHFPGRPLSSAVVEPVGAALVPGLFHGSLSAARPLMVVGLLDHYWWTAPPAQLAFTTVLALWVRAGEGAYSASWPLTTK